MSYKVKLDIFEGPLDLLLYLIKKNEVDIYDIPIAIITEQYLEYMDLMKVLNLDKVGEFLVMAATLIKIKSKMLLPPAEDIEEDEDGVDPRTELLEHLLEYQRYKEAAHQLKNRDLIEKDIFTRIQRDEDVSKTDKDSTVIEVSLFDLVDALRKVIERKDLSDQFMEVTVEKFSVKDKMVEILQKLKETQHIIFVSLFDELSTKYEIIVAFLAILELMRLRAVKVFQVQPHGEIRIISLRGEIQMGDITAG
ncbi:MAG: segregation/condensation protein A [Deltaproteobacteria bacterium]|nr:segregation/condensation protein A [Deltaproteobacteria bacterium]